MAAAHRNEIIKRRLEVVGPIKILQRTSASLASSGNENDTPGHEWSDCNCRRVDDIVVDQPR